VHVQCRMLRHARKSKGQGKARPAKKGESTVSPHSASASWGSPWSVSRQQQKEAWTAFWGETGSGFGLHELGLDFKPPRAAELRPNP
jgi:hypothetical protein